MAGSKRLSPRIRLELWKRFEQGFTFERICDGLEVSLPGAWHHITSAGGIAPRPRKRRANALSELEREEISRCLAAGKSIRFIAGQLGRAASTIAREVARNGGCRHYRAARAERRASQQARRPQRCKLARRRRLRRCVAGKLRRKWSPQQIANWLRVTFADDAAMQVSHETIYRTLYVQARGALRKELQQYLRTHRTYRRPRVGGTNSTASIVDGISISERPASVEDRAVPGHWEGDLIFGTTSSYIATLVERSTRFVMLVKTPSKDTNVVTAALQKHIKRLPSQLRRSLTWDRGSEMSAHAKFSVDADIDVYFCDPASPWQRGSNENTNGLLRQYFPKGEDVSKYDQRKLDRVARELNGRPRQTLGWRSPTEVLNQLLQ